MIRDVFLAAALLAPWAVAAGTVVLDDGPLLDFRNGAKSAFESRIDHAEHIRGFASIGDQAKGVANARQEFCGHYLDLCATYWQLDRLECAKARGRRVVEAAGRAMSADGYIGGETAERRLVNFSLWNQSHAVYGLLRFASATGDETARKLGLKAADWLLSALEKMTPARLADKRKVGNDGSQHLVALYALGLAHQISGDKRYSAYVGKTILGLENTGMNLLSNPHCLRLQSKKGIEMINAWRGVLAFAKYADDVRAGDACAKYWHSVADTQIRNTGAATNRERFLSGGGAPAILPVEMRPNENCVQCGWLRFTRELFASSGDVRCAHEMERTLYNHILGSAASDGTDFAYYQGNVGRKVFRMNGLYQCCRYRGFAVMAHLPELVLDDNGECVTLLVYAPLTYTADDGLVLKVSTDYPRSGRIELRIAAKKTRRLKLPVPSWCREWMISVDGRPMAVEASHGFAEIELPASRETTVLMDFKMELVRKVRDIGGKRYAEFSFGPLVLVRDTGYGDRLGDALAEDITFLRRTDGSEFARFTACDSTGRVHTLVDYAHACRKNPGTDEFEVFIPVASSQLTAPMLESGEVAVEIDPAVGGFTVTDKRSGRVWRCKKALPADGGLTLTDIMVDGRCAVAEMVSAVGDLAGKAIFRLDGAELGIEMDFSSIPSGGHLFPAPFGSQKDDAAVLPLGEGFRIPLAECDLVVKNDLRVWHGDMSMSFYGVVDKSDECGWMAILETPDDVVLRCTPDGKRLGCMAPAWKPELGHAGYSRKMRFVFFDKGGYVAMAKRYRAFAKGCGRVKTFAEKVKERPMVERLPGAANVWYFPGKGDPSHAQMAAELREAGIGRFIWSSYTSRRDDVARIAAMPDVLIGRYDVYRDVYYPELLDALGWSNPPKSDICRNTSAWPDDVMWDGSDSNSWRRAWGVMCKDGKKRSCAAQCDIPAIGRLKRNVTEELKTMPFTSRFIDVVTAVGWEECRNPAHPMTRRISRRAKLDLLRMLGEEFALVVGAEQGKDEAVAYCDYFEGMMSPRCARMPHGRAGYGRKEIFRDDGSVPERLTSAELDRMRRYALNEKYRIPLFELVYHDCVASHWYWYDYSNHPICFWKKRDCFNSLYGTSPMYIFDYAQWNDRKKMFVESWDRVGRIARMSGFSEMISHRCISSDRSLQETRFANGLVVTVDFATNEIKVICPNRP